MALRPEDRYATPLALAEDVERWIADEPVSAYREPWSRRAGRWRRRHRTAVAVATVAAALLGIGGVMLLAQRLRTDAAGSAALDQAGRRAEEARAASDPAKWSEAIAEARRAEALLDSGGGGRSLRARARERLAAYQEALRAEERDRRMTRDLDEARLLRADIKGGHLDLRGMQDAMLGAFRWYGIDVAALPPGEAAALVRASRLRGPLIEALDEWAASKPAEPTPGRLIAIAKAADDAPGNAEVHDLIERGDVAGIRKLVSGWATRGDDKLRDLPSVRALAFIDPAGCLPLLEARRRETPSDFWYNNTLANAYLRGSPPDLAKAARYYTAAVALRPTSPGARMKLGEVFHYMGDLVGAEVEHREATSGSGAPATPRSATTSARRPTGPPGGGPPRTEAEYREAIRIRPDLAEARYNLGTMLRERGRPVEAEAEFREAIRIKPDYADAHTSLGFVLEARGRPAEAEAELREDARIRPGHAPAHHNLGIILGIRGKPAEAEAEYREALRIRPGHAEDHFNLGNILRDRGELGEAATSFRLARDHCPKDSPLLIMIAQSERLIPLAKRLPAILRGEDRPADADEAIGLADICTKRSFHATASRLYEEAFAFQPALAEKPVAFHRYNAACAAALSAAGRGKDGPPPDDAARARLREQARAGLRADLAALSKLLNSGTPQAADTVAKTLAHWKADADLATLRDEAALAKLPEAEQTALRALWADAEALLAKAGAKAAPPAR